MIIMKKCTRKDFSGYTVLGCERYFIRQPCIHVYGLNVRTKTHFSADVI